MKAIFLACIIALASIAHCQSNVSIVDGEQFFLGFAVPLNLTTNAQNIVTCTNQTGNSAIFGLLAATVQELEAKNFTSAIKSVFAFYTELEKTDASCQSDVQPFTTLFAPAIAALKSSPVQFDETVAKNLEGQPIPTLEHTVQLALALRSKSYNLIGEQFGYITVIGLSSYINNGAERGFLEY